jgi:hypothetical protein
VDSWQIVLVLYLASFAVGIVFAGATAGLLRLVGGRTTAIDLSSPALIPVRRAAPRIRLGPVPVGIVHIFGAGEPAEVEIGERDWRGLGLARQLIVIVGPWLALGAAAIALLGPAHAARSFGSAIDQLVFTLDPTPIVRRFFAVAAAATLPVTVGILLAKLVVLNLLPLGTLAGGKVVGVIAGAGRREPPKVVQIWLVLTAVFVLLYFGARFAYALIRAIAGQGDV